MLLVERADETPSLDGEQRYRLNVLRLRPAHDDLLHAPIAAGDQVGISEEKPPSSNRGHDLHVWSRLPHKIRVIVLKVPACANAFRPARRDRTRLKSRKEERSRPEPLHFVFH